MLLLWALRLVAAAALAAAPAGAVLARIQHAPDGELQLLAREGVVLVELVRRPAGLPGYGTTAAVLLVLVHLVCILPTAALVVSLARPRSSLRESVTVGVERFTALARVSGLSARAVGAAAALGLSAVAPLAKLAEDGTLRGELLELAARALGFAPCVLVAVFADATRVETACGDASWARRLRAAWMIFVRGFGRLAVRYVGYAAASALVGGAAAAAVVRLVLLPGALAVAAAVAVSALALLALVAMRAHWLGAIVARRRPDPAPEAAPP
jgi:hypothetical protein